MSAAAVLAGLAAAGTTVATSPAGKLCLRGSPPPPALRAAVPRVGRALLRVASERWRLDLAGWPSWRREAWEERAAIMAEGGAPAELVEQLAYLDTAEQHEPVDDGVTDSDGEGGGAPGADRHLDARSLAPQGDPQREDDPQQGASLPPDVDPDDPAALDRHLADPSEARAAGPHGLDPDLDHPAGGELVAVDGPAAPAGRPGSPVDAGAEGPPVVCTAPPATPGGEFKAAPRSLERFQGSPPLPSAARAGRDHRVHQVDGGELGACAATNTRAADLFAPPAVLLGAPATPVEAPGGAAGGHDPDLEGPAQPGATCARRRPGVSSMPSSCRRRPRSTLRPPSGSPFWADSAPTPAALPVDRTSIDGFTPADAPDDTTSGPGNLSPGPPRRPLPAWRWADVVPMGPDVPQRDPAAPFPHPLDKPRRCFEVNPKPLAPPAPSAAPTALPDKRSGDESADVRAARFGYVITPWGEYIEADRIEEPHRVPFQPRFEVRWRPKTEGA